MNVLDIVKNNNDFLDNHFDQNRRLIYDDIKAQDIPEDFAVKLADEIWLEIKGYPLSNNISSQEKIEIFRNLWPIAIIKRKSKLPFDFYKKFDVRELKEDILNLGDEFWCINQKKGEKYPVHKHTEVLGNTVFPIYYDGTQSLDVYKNNYIPKHIQMKIDKIVYELETQFDGKVLISGLTKLSANKCIPPHIDDLYYFKIIKRFQIAINTNSKVYFDIDNQIKIFEEGDCYQINNLLKHSVSNEGNTDRINLIIDIMPWENINGYYSLICMKKRSN